MKNVAVYYRVSTDRQEFASQRDAVETWLHARPNRPESVATYSDMGLSGRKGVVRPGFNQLMADAAAGKFEAIVVYKLDRLSRDASTAIRLILDLDDMGVAFISVTQPILQLGHDNPFRRTMIAAFSEIAEIERQTIVARIHSGLAAARRRGVRLGPPIKVTPDVRSEILAMREARYTFAEIARETGLSIGKVHQVVKASNLVVVAEAGK